MRRGTVAFTLIEMLVCVVIIMILSVICVASYSGALESAAVKLALPDVTWRIESYKRNTRETKAMITVECLEGRDEMRVTWRNAYGTRTKIEKLDTRGFLGRRLAFRAYKWPDGAKAPRTFTFLPDESPKGGTVWFGTGLAEGKIMVQGGEIKWEM